MKSNIGHLEPASGLAGVLKTLLALQRGLVPATLHQKSPSPDIPFDELNLRVVDRNWTLPERRGPALAGVNSFGFGGTNAHVVLRGEDRTVAVAHLRGDLPPPPLLLSAHAGDVLPAVARRTLEAWPADRRLVGDFIAAAAHQRDTLTHRALIRGATPEALRHQVERFAAGESLAGNPDRPGGRSERAGGVRVPGQRRAMGRDGPRGVADQPNLPGSAGGDRRHSSPNGRRRPWSS